MNKSNTLIKNLFTASDTYRKCIILSTKKWIWHVLSTNDQCSNALINPWLLLVIIIILHFANEKQLAVLLVNCFVLGKYRDVTKISSYWVKLSRLGIRHLGISFGCIVLLFSHESGQGKILAPPLNDSPERSDFLFLDLVAPPPHPPCYRCRCSSPFPPPMCTFLRTRFLHFFPIRMPATQATCTLIDGELLSIMHKIIFKTAPTMAFRRGQNYTATLQVGTILVTMAPKILELVTWFVKQSPLTKRVGCQMATKQKL